MRSEAIRRASSLRSAPCTSIVSPSSLRSIPVPHPASSTLAQRSDMTRSRRKPAKLALYRASLARAYSFQYSTS